MLVGQCAEGLTGRWDRADGGPAALRVPLGEGLLGAVAATGEPRRGPGRPRRAGLSPRRAALPHVRRGAVLPRPAPAPRPSRDAGAAGRACGVLALYDRLGSDEFDDADLVTLRTFAGQAAVAVDNVRVHEEAQRLSLTDPLTGLWNYRYLRESLRREVERASRFGRMLAVLALDLDQFKEVNDTLRARAPATRCWPSSPAGSGPRSARSTWRSGRAARSSWCCCRRPTRPAARSSPSGSARRVRRAPIVVDADRRRADRASPITVSIGIAVYPGPRRHRRRRCSTPPTTRCTRRRPPAGTRTGWPTVGPSHGRRRTRPISSADAPAARPAGHSRRGRAVADSLAACRSRPSDPATSHRRRAGRGRSKAVIPAAGLATRFLPATKAVPKELLPVVDRPVLQYIVEEAAAAGISDVLLITGRGKTRWSTTSTASPYLEARLEEKGDHERLAAVRRTERAGRDLHLPAGRAARPRARGRRTPSRTSATSRSRCCSATSSSTRPSRCCRRCSTCRPAPAASCSPSSRSTREEVTRYGIASVDAGRRRADRRRRGRHG